MICKIERHIGQQLRRQRQALKLTQQQVAETLNLTSQQIHKYEKGVNRISASQLLSLSKVLLVPTNFFYEGLEEGGSLTKENDLQHMCANLKGKRIHLKMLDLSGIVTDIKLVQESE